LSGTSGKHGSHAKPGRLSTTKARVTTAVAVSGVVLGGGVAGAAQLRQHSGNQQEAGTGAARLADAQAAQDVAARNAALGGVANRSTLRPPLVAVTTPSGARDPQQVELFGQDLAVTPAAGSLSSATPAAGPASGPTAPAGAAPSSSGLPALPSSTSSSATAPAATSSSSTAKPAATTKPAPTASSSTALQGYNATPAQARAIAQQLVPTAQFACFDNIIERESSWNIHATNASSGAYGLPQALPGSKMGTVAADWRNNAVTQIKWGLDYMTSRYGSPCSAWAFWQTHHWY
jgi:hypothetical protein